MIQNLLENERYTINYFKDGQRESIDLLEALTNHDSESNDSSVLLYETDGNSGLLGLNNASISDGWQFESDFSRFKSIKCYFKESDHDCANKNLTPSVIIELSLDNASLSKSVVSSNIGSIKTPCNIYIASVISGMVNEKTSFYKVSVAVDNEKKRFKVADQYIVTGSNIKFANNDGRYLYKIIGIK